VIWNGWKGCGTDMVAQRNRKTSEKLQGSIGILSDHGWLLTASESSTATGEKNIHRRVWSVTGNLGHGGK